MEYIAKPADAGRRLDVLVASLYPQFTRSSLEILFDNGMVAANGEPARPSYKVKPQDKLHIDETYLNAELPQVKLPVLYEDARIIVINKPAGILTHSKGALNLEPTVAGFISDKIKDKEMTGNRAGIVHRLDRGTSGVLIAAKTSDALRQLQKQFSTRKVKKIYEAIVEGRLEPPQAIIDAPIARNPNKPQTFTVKSSGKSAITEYKTLKNFEKENIAYTLAELQPQTGRTHQLRVHMAYIGHPIAGDRVYGKAGEQILLHAKSLELTLPGGARKVFEVKPPPAFREFIDND